jgi:C-terminal processing protease CtpA/Prc
MRNLLFSTIALQFLWSVAPLKAAEPALTKVQIARLESLCRVWGVVKFFHPWIIAPPDGKPIDWDAALIETIPLVEKASTTQEFRSAIDHLLSALHDPATRPMPGAERQNARQSPVKPALPDTKSIESGGKKVLVISAADWRRLAAQESKSPGNLFTKAFAEAADADAIVLDLRLKGADSGVALQPYLSTLLKTDLPLPAPRSRFHRGYESQDDSVITTSYHSGFLTREHTFLRAKPGPSAGKRLIVLTSVATQAEFGVFAALQSEFGVFAALQSSGQAIIIHDSADFSNFAEKGVVYRMQVGENIWATIRTADYINADGTVGLRPGAVVERLNGEGDDPTMRAGLAIARGESPPLNRPASHRMASPIRRAENSYPEMVSPTREYRLLGLFRVWNVMHYFFPHHDLMDRSWDSVLTEFLPRFASADKSEDYGLLAHELLAQLQDSHCAALNGLAATARQHVGYPVSSILLRTVHGEMVVVSADASVKDKVRVGDVVLAVDGEPIASRRDKLKKYISASTPQIVNRSLSLAVLLGPLDSPARLTLRAPDGAVREESLPRTQDDISLWPWRGPQPERTTPVYSVLPESYGYIDIVRLTDEQVQPALEAVRNSPALILDMRGRPSNIAGWGVCSRLTENSYTVLKSRTPFVESPDPSQNTSGYKEQIASPSPQWKYAGRVIVLINEFAQSAAEHSCQGFEAAAKGRIKFIGTPTSGANGNVTVTSMPGGIIARFTGMDIRHADGRQLQRVGIQPDIRVEPTIAGIAAGKDEVLEAAIKFLNESKAG